MMTQRTRILLVALTCSSLLSTACGGAVAQEADGTATLSYAAYTADEAGFHVTSTLIYGPTEAVLVDGQFTLAEGQAVAEWIGGHDVALSAIWVTHGHPDHYFGLQPVLDAFPNTPVYATAEVVDEIRETMQAKLDYWGPLYGEALTTAPVVPEVYAGDSLTVDGQTLALLSVEQGDTEATTVVHVPSLDLLVAGDVAFHDVHVWLADAPGAEQRAAWIQTLRTLQALEPSHVVAGHRAPSASDDPEALEWTAQYISAFANRFDELGSGAPLEGALLAGYPEALLPVIAQFSAGAAQ